MSSSSLSVEDEQRWMPTHVQVTVLRGRGLRAKGKHGTSDVYTIIQLAKEKFSTCVVEKTTAPEWKEECTFDLLPGLLEADGRSAYPPGSSDLVLTVMHRALIGLDVFLGEAIIPLDRVFREKKSAKNEWYKLHSKSGKKEKERGEIQVAIQFTRNNLTASMYDLSIKDKPRSTLDRLKDRMKGKKRADGESTSAILPVGYGALSQIRGRLPSDGGGEEDYEDDEGGEGRRNKMRNFFLRGKLRKSSDTRSSTSLGSESSESSSRGGSLSPTAGISVVVSDLSNSPSNSSNLTADNSPEHTTNPSPMLKTHKRAFSDEASQVTSVVAQPHAVESLKGPSGALSQSSMCINGSHVYEAEAPVRGSSVTLPATLGLLQKCSPLSRSLQNLTRRSEDGHKDAAGEGRRWSFDKAGKDEKAAIAAALEQASKGHTGSRPVQVAVPVVSVLAKTAAEQKKHKNMFSHGGSALDHAKEEQGVAARPEDKQRGWFGSKDSQNKPSPHPVKPLTTAAAPEEKKEGRSVLVSGLEKLKSTIHPGRGIQQSEPEAERNKALCEGAATYEHLTHNELVSLLLQREAELRRQGCEFVRQGALLESREAELKNTKLLVRDLEDYIDTLLVRIMEHTPNLLHVRSKLK
ncbi:rab11 family-interacting protein 5-like [Scleropages formosus]|uniref:Rab11 family-interacting protein 5-like n=2 Tax=Scleropages formosus TaxID=113540 RepID=A0A8C9RNQ5_SCLFO|nr:rab11 family-interacting protein 5-like [Scleropages formosus]